MAEKRKPGLLSFGFTKRVNKTMKIQKIMTHKMMKVQKIRTNQTQRKKTKQKDILHLLILMVIPVSSAQCERTISADNRIKSDVRSCLDPTTVEALIRISSEGPPIEEFKTNAVVERWFSQKRTVNMQDGQMPSNFHKSRPPILLATYFKLSIC